MALNLSILKPEAGTNLVTNPSLESAATGYTARVGTIARSSTAAAVGAYALSVTPSAATDGGEYYAISLTISTTYTYSAHVKGIINIPYLLAITSTADAVLASTAFTGTGAWQRVAVTYT